MVLTTLKNAKPLIHKICKCGKRFTTVKLSVKKCPACRKTKPPIEACKYIAVYEKRERLTREFESKNQAEAFYAARLVRPEDYILIQVYKDE